MSVNPIPAFALRGDKQLSVVDFVPRFQPKGHQHSTIVYNQRAPFEDSFNNIISPNIMNDAIQRPMALAPRPCKEEPFSTRRLFRTNTGNMMSGLYPQTGVFRNEKKGLAYDPKKPINLPLMPLANSFSASLNNNIAPVR